MMNQLEKSMPPISRLTTGMMMSFTSESTILPKAAPMMTPTARSTTLPFNANSRNSVMNDIAHSSDGVEGRPRGDRPLLSNGGFARFAGADAHRLLHVCHEYFPVADLAGA